MKPQEQEDWRERFKHLFIEGNMWQSDDGSTVYSAVGNMENFIATEIERAKAERDEEIRDWVEIRARADHMDASGKIYGHGSDYCKGWGQCSTDLINFLDTPQEENRKEL